eukprot:gene2341-17978_t
MEMRATDRSEETISNEMEDATSVIATLKHKPVIMSYGLLTKVKYEHKSKNCKIQSVTYNSKTCEYVIVDSRGISAWSNSYKLDKTSRLLEFPAYQFNVIKILLYCRPFNLYFALTREYQLKIYNLNFHETFSIESDTKALIHMIFNADTNELVTASRSEIQIWKFGELNRQNDSTKASYGLILERKWTIDKGRLINRINLDNECQRLYCLSESDIWCYDLTGRFVFFIKKACSTHLSACAYANTVHSVIAGSIDGQISILTNSGGKIHSFLSHSSLITEIMIHPSDGHLVITSSLDGYVKIFSLDLLEELYSLKVFSEGIEYMALRSENLLFCVSTKEIEIFDLNYFCQFWGQLQYQAQTIELVRNSKKSNRLMVVDSDSSMKLFSVKHGKKLCTVLPPPTVGQSNNVLACVHDRDYNLVYFLVTPSEIWVYTTKTDPACFLAPIDLWEEPQHEKTSREPTLTPQEPMGTPYSGPEDQNFAVKINCNCIEVLQDFFETEFFNGDGVLQTKCNFLGCGMENGDILLCNPLMGGRKEKTISLFKDPIIGLRYVREQCSCLVMTKGSESLILKMINSNLETSLSVFCENDISCYALKENSLAVGFLTGHILVNELPGHDQRAFVMTKSLSVDHYQGVLSVSFHPVLSIVCSSGKDSCIKIWSLDKNLLCEINVNNSLTSACFLNSSGEILMGFHGHIFIIRNQRQLSWLSCKEDENEDQSNSGSEIYESPHIKYELKRPPSPVSDNMENYLVPYQDTMFSTIGTWVVDKGSDMFSFSDNDSILLKDQQSDDESLAPTEIYQSSVYSASSRGTELWGLPACGDSPEESVTESDEDVLHQETFDDEKEERKEESKKPTETKSRLEELLAKTEQKKDSGSLKGRKFAHGSSEKLKNAKIDSKKLKSKQKQKGPSSLKDITVTDQSKNDLPKENELALKSGKRQIVKKVKKTAESRTRVSAKKTVIQQAADNVSSAELSNTLDSKMAQQDRNELVDGGYSSPAFDNDTQESEKHVKLTDEYGVSVVKNQIRLATSAKKVDSVYKNSAEKTLKSPDTVDQVNKGLRGNHTQENVDEKVDVHERPGVSSAQFDSLCSSPISVYTHENVESPLQTENTFSSSPLKVEESLADSPFQIGFKDSPASFGDKSVDRLLQADIENSSAPEEESKGVKTRNRKSVFGSNMQYISNISKESSNLSSGTGRTQLRGKKHKTEPKRPPKDFVKTRVVPAYEPRSWTESNAKKALAAHVPLEMRSEKVTLRESSERNQRPAIASGTRRARRRQEKVPVLKRRSSQAVRVPVGDFIGTERFLSSSSIELRNDSPMINVQVEENAEEQTADVLKFCVSALKKKNRNIRRTSTSARANSAGVKFTDAAMDGGADQEMMAKDTRPNTAFYDQESYVNTFKNAQEDFDDAQIEAVNHTNMVNDQFFNKSVDSLRSEEITTEDHLEDQAVSHDGDEFSFRVTISRGNNLRKEGNDWREERGTRGYDEEFASKSLNMFGNQMIKRGYEKGDGGTGDQESRGFDPFQYVSVGRERASHAYHQESYEPRTTRTQHDIPISIYKKVRSSLFKRSQENIHDTAGTAIRKKVDEFMSRETTELFMLNERTVSFYDEVETVKGSPAAIRSKDYNNWVSNAPIAPVASNRRLKQSYSNPITHDSDASKQGLIFVSLPTTSDERNYVADDEEKAFYILNSADQGRKTETPAKAQSIRVASPQDKLLERRAFSARLRRRHESAKFRRDVIERQKRARAGNRSASPTYSRDYPAEFFADDEKEARSPCMYEYSKPLPLPDKPKTNPNGNKPKALRARLSGQSFRYGKPVANDENEAVIVDFIRSSLSKTGDGVNLLPRPKSTPSIPAKCHKYILVTETTKQEQKLSKREEELLRKRFSEFSLEVS